MIQAKISTYNHLSDMMNTSFQLIGFPWSFNRLKFSSKHSSCITKWKITANPKILHQTKMTITKNIYPQRRIQVNDIKITEILTNWGKLNNHQIWWSPNIRASKKKREKIECCTNLTKVLKNIVSLTFYRHYNKTNIWSQIA